MKNFVKCAIAFLLYVTAAYCVTYACEMPAPVFDTSVLQNWCRGADHGPIRMVGAWVNEQGLVEDEQGNLWLFDEQVSADDFLLLWIADNHTPNDQQMTR